MKTITLLGPFNQDNGITAFVRDNYTQLCSQGFRFRVINIAREHPDEGLRQLGKYRTAAPFGKRPDQLMKHLRTVRRELQVARQTSSIIHLHLDTLVNFAPILLAREEGFQRIIIHAHADRRGQDRWERDRLHRLGMMVAAHKATDFIACSQFAADYFYPPAVQQRATFKVIVNGVAPEKYRFDAHQARITRQRLGIAPDKFVIGHLGRFLPQKNQQFLLRTFARVHQQNQATHLVLVGDGKQLAATRELAARLGITANVTFTGFLRNPRLVMNTFDLFALPSLYEGLSLSLQENIANGTPALISPNQSPEAHQVGQVRVCPLDEQQWVDELVAAAAHGHPDKLTYSVANAGAFVNAGYTLTATVQQLAALYE
ncbi:glycosyltransferase [Ligilactobacillus sp. LYQ112]|uniref:glycosyltransferase n=1 Tax=Ligilactobacillus sp. LYQ112 TaxID=3391060 RepID=UPI003982F858